MKKIFVEYPLSGDTVLTGDDHAHVSVVLRAKKGDTVTLCDGSGYDFLYEIVGFDRASTKLRLVEKRLVDVEPSLKVDLFAAVIKADKLEWTVQKCTELGIHAFFPFMSEYCQTKPESVKVERLNKIAKEAAQQCGRGMVPSVDFPINFNEAIEKLHDYDNVIFLYEKGGVPLGQTALKSGSTAIVIGPEGGFSDDEAQRLSSFAHTVTLGKRILRAETASVAAATLTMFVLGELQ